MSKLDQVILVDRQDRAIGACDKILAHLGAGKRHRAISVFLFNSKGETLIQQRSVEKIVGGNLWANTCCGNVRPGETRLQCANRRLKEELGIQGVKLKKIGIFEYHIPCDSKFSEWEIDAVYIGNYDGLVVPNPKEVKKYRWLPAAQFVKELMTNQKDFAPWVQKILESTKIRKFLK